MNKFEINEFLSQFVDIIEEGGSKLRAEAENYSQGFRSRREISKLESLIRDDFVNVGLLVYELHKMGKSFEYSDFEEKFRSIDEKKSLLSNLEREAQEGSENTQGQENFFQEEESDEPLNEDSVICKNCNTENTKYVAYCKNCGEEL